MELFHKNYIELKKGTKFMLTGLLDFSHFSEIAGFHVTLHRVRHAADEKIFVQAFHEFLVKRPGEWREIVLLLDGAPKPGFAHAVEKFRERHGVKIEKIDFSNGKRPGPGESHADQRSRRGDVEGFGPLHEIFQRIQRVVGGLDFVENDQVSFGKDLAPRMQSEVFDDPVGREAPGKKIVERRIFLEIEICEVVIFPFAEFAQDPGFSDLARAP